MTISDSTVVVLEDDPRRSNEMKAAFSDSGIELVATFFDSAFRLCEWLNTNAASVVAISLDYDLDTTTAIESTDAGFGDQIVDWLIANKCMIPVIIHSSNAMQAPAMHMNLAMAGWTKLKLAPFSNASQWIDDIKDLL